MRVGIHWFVTKPFFDGFIMFVILLSSVALAAEDPVQENHPRNLMLKNFDYGFTAIFAIECTLKVTFPRNSPHSISFAMIRSSTWASSSTLEPIFETFGTSWTAWSYPAP